ncbi:MAG: hypothetical protein AAF429_09160 [Pseudomonadota bacterium]
MISGVGAFANRRFAGLPNVQLLTLGVAFILLCAEAVAAAPVIVNLQVFGSFWDLLEDIYNEMIGGVTILGGIILFVTMVMTLMGMGNFWKVFWILGGIILVINIPNIMSQIT